MKSLKYAINTSIFLDLTHDPRTGEYNPPPPLPPAAGCAPSWSCAVVGHARGRASACGSQNLVLSRRLTQLLVVLHMAAERIERRQRSPWLIPAPQTHQPIVQRRLLRLGAAPSYPVEEGCADGP